MNFRRSIFVLGAIVAIAGFTGCATVPPTDYTEFRKSRPKSILVLPPWNESNEVLAPYSLLTTVTRPLAELGYYVFPVVMVDQFLKENGLTVADDMHQAPLEKIRDVFGADAVLYITVEKYGSKYQLISSNMIVYARASWWTAALARYSGKIGLKQFTVGNPGCWRRSSPKC